MNKNELLLKAPIAPTMLKMATPNIIAMLITSSTILAEAWFVGHLGTIPLAGLALGFPMYMLILMFSTGSIGGAIAGLVARHLGSGDRHGAETIVLHGFVLAVFLAILSMAIFLFGGELILRAIGGTGPVLEKAILYTDFLFTGILTVWLSQIIGSVLRGAGEMKVAAFWMIAASSIQIIAGGGFILGIAPFPHMGIAGAALGAILGYGVAALGQIIFLLRGRAGISLRFRGIQLERQYFKVILQIGLVASTGPVLSIGTTIIITALAARISSTALAAYGIGSRLELLLTPIVFGIGTACITMIGANFGAGKINRGHRIGWIGGITAGSIAGFIGLIFALQPHLWTDFFSDNKAVQESCAIYLRFVGPTYFFFGLGLCFYFASQGVGKMFWPVLGNVARIAVIIGGGLIILWLDKLTLEYLYTIVAVSMIVYGLFVAGSVKLGAWRTSLPPKTSQ